MKASIGIAPLLAALVLLCSCRGERMTYREALEAVEQAAISGKGEALTGEIIEISTDFTLGQAAAEAAEELYLWLESQIPCSTVSLADHTVTVDFGDLADACTYNEHTYAGIWEIAIQAAEEGGVVVDHGWTGLTNGDVTLDGTAQVTWSGGDASRRVVHAVTWSDPERTVEASGDRLQTLIDPDLYLAGGIEIDGDRDWAVDGDDWHLDIDQVEMRGQDPVPQAGEYVLTTPADKTVTLAFERIDENTIRCTLTAPNKTWTFDVSRSGEVS